MSFSPYGFSAMTTCIIAVVFIAVSFGLPAWTHIEKNNQKVDSVAKVDYDFAFGVYALCQFTDVESIAPGNTTDNEVDQCYGYYSGMDSYFINYNKSDGVAYLEKKDESLCDMYDDTDGKVTIEGLDTEKLNDFLKKTCGSMGHSTMAFLLIGIICGSVGLVFLLVGVTCVRKVGAMNIGGLFCDVAGICGLISFIIWSYQEGPLQKDDDAESGSMYYLCICSSVFFFITQALCVYHVKRVTE